MIGRKVDKVLIDLDTYKIILFFPDTKKPLILFFDTVSRRFFFSVITLMVIEMKKDSFLSYVPLRKCQTVLESLDKHFLQDKASKIEANLYEKIRKAWTGRLRDLNKAEGFKILNRSKNPYGGNIEKEKYACPENECDAWDNLLGYHPSKKLLYKFDSEKVGISLDDVVVNFDEKTDIAAWKSFLKSLDTKEIIQEKKYDHLITEAQKEAYITLLREFVEFSHSDDSYFMPAQSKVLDWFVSPILSPLEKYFRSNQTNKSTNLIDTKKLMPKSVGGVLNFDNNIVNSTVSWNEAKQNNRLIILGDPGIGKSTLMLFEFVSLTQTAINALLSKKVKFSDVKIPVYFRISELSRTSIGFLNAMIKQLKRNHPKSKKIISTLIKNKIDEGNLVLLLDAFDEVSLNKRKKIIKKLRFFSRENSCKIICSSRLSGYNSRIFHSSKDFLLLPLDNNNRKEFISTYLTIYGTPHLSKSLDAFVRILNGNQRLKDLAKNPQMMSLLTRIFNEGEINLPVSKAEVYAKISNLMLRGFNIKYFDKSSFYSIPKKRLLEDFAFTFLKEAQDIFSEDELYEYFDKYLIRDNCPKEIKMLSPVQILQELVMTDGILTKKTPSSTLYFFIHRSLQEYYAASYISGIFRKNIQAGLDLIKDHIWDLGWHEIIYILVGLIENKDVVVEFILNQKDDIFDTLLALASNCLCNSEGFSIEVEKNVMQRLLLILTLRPTRNNFEDLLLSLCKINYTALTSISILAFSGGHVFREKLIPILGRIQTNASNEVLKILFESKSVDPWHLGAILAYTVDFKNELNNEILNSLKNGMNSVKNQNISPSDRKTAEEWVSNQLNRSLTDNEKIIFSYYHHIIKDLSDLSLNNFAVTEKKGNVKEEEQYLEKRTKIMQKWLGSSEKQFYRNQHILEQIEIESITSTTLEHNLSMMTKNAFKSLLENLKKISWYENIKAAAILSRTNQNDCIDALISHLNRISPKNAFGTVICELLYNNGSIFVLERIIKDPDLNIYDPNIYKLAELLFINNYDKKSDIIPIYPETIRKYKRRKRIKRKYIRKYGYEALVEGLKDLERHHNEWNVASSFWQRKMAIFRKKK